MSGDALSDQDDLTWIRTDLLPSSPAKAGDPVNKNALHAYWTPACAALARGMTTEGGTIQVEIITLY
jgi:hypothetical protein